MFNFRIDILKFMLKIFNIYKKDTVLSSPISTGIYVLRVINGNTGTMSEICLKSQERGYWHRSGVFIVNFQALTLNRFHIFLWCFDFEEINAGWIGWIPVQSNHNDSRTTLEHWFNLAIVLRRNRNVRKY